MTRKQLARKHFKELVALLKTKTEELDSLRAGYLKLAIELENNLKEQECRTK